MMSFISFVNNSALNFKIFFKNSKDFKNEEFPFIISFFFRLALSTWYRNVIWLINFRNIWLTWAEGKIIFLCYWCDEEERKRIYSAFYSEQEKTRRRLKMKARPCSSSYTRYIVHPSFCNFEALTYLDI